MSTTKPAVQKSVTTVQNMMQSPQLLPYGPHRKVATLLGACPIIQRNRNSIAEVTQTLHKENSAVIHINPNTMPSGINRNEFNKWRTDYWEIRSNDF